ncbi:roadblock/LC7 domain-containing protein, partial [Streptomyces sp. NPDC002536]
MTDGKELEGLLDDLAQRVESIRYALVLSNDGLV